ncbi:MAG: tyrosine-type recombinase/integrase [Pseudomonadota bacterium]
MVGHRHHGARVTEACNLRVRDIRWEGYALLTHTKNGTARLVRLTRLMLQALDVLCRDKGPNERVFGYAGRDGVNKALRRICDAAGIQYLSSHQCGRHTFSARMLRQGESSMVLKQAGGWKSLSVVDETYGHLERSQVDAAIDRLDDSDPLNLGADVATDDENDS